MATNLAGRRPATMLDQIIPALTRAERKRAQELRNALFADGRARVADLHARLFPNSTPASANASLNRLIAALNKTATATGIPVSVQITAEKKIGAAARWVWCETEEDVPPMPFSFDTDPMPGLSNSATLKTFASDADLYLWNRTVEAPVEEPLPWLQAWAHDATEERTTLVVAGHHEARSPLCRGLAQALWTAWQADRRLPCPLYFDLSLLTGLDQRTPTLDQALSECMERGWMWHGTPCTLDDLHRWIARYGAVVIFDGLNTVLERLDARNGAIFSRSLMKLRADAIARARPGAAPSVKVVVATPVSFATGSPLRTHLAPEHGWVRPEALALLHVAPPQER